MMKCLDGQSSLERDLDRESGRKKRHYFDDLFVGELCGAVLVVAGEDSAVVVLAGGVDGGGGTTAVAGGDVCLG